MPDLLIEIGCEELPAVACREAERQLAPLCREGLAREEVEPAEVRVYVAPRRLAVVAAGLPAQRPARRSEQRGPRSDAPEQARSGFARKHGLEPEALTDRDGFLWAISDGAPTPLGELAQPLLDGILRGLHFSKSMRWDGGRFSRPVRWLVCKVDGEVAPVTAFGLIAGAGSEGRREGGGAVDVGSAATYLDDLRSVQAMADAGERRQRIEAGLEQVAGWADPLAKLDEVVYLVEWPSVLSGSFDERFLALPQRVVVTAMQSHQRYFPVMDGDGLAPRFVFVANGGEPETVIRGNGEVLAGRLADAEFAYRNDLERGIAAMAGELGRVSFLEGSGSLAEKTARVRQIVDGLSARVGADAAARADAVRAAELCKADLVSGLVGEFGDLQGYAGSLYAQAAGEPQGVSRAIAEHHLPTRQGGDLPASEAGALLAVADKADTLREAFRLGLQPTGSRDPLGLRRAAAGLVAIALERGWELGVEELVGAHAVGFLLDRVEATLTEEGVAVEEVRAARPLAEPVRVAELARALHAHAGPQRDALRDAYRRCTHILGGELAPVELDDGLLAPAGQALARSLDALEGTVTDVRRPFDDRLEAALEIGSALAQFFDEVLVMDPDPRVRSNNLTLLSGVRGTLGSLGDFDQLPG
ncbi:MAG TPA: glycine--tRNA ligase subunit beta [Gaiellales bacterium]|nr:glycine--tRNA ligase subunit beta [Gaiellales bacterium]